jgi:hypothetical protein
VTDAKRSVVRRLRRVGADRLGPSAVAAATDAARGTRAVYRVTPSPRRNDPENGYDTSLKLLQSLHGHDGTATLELWGGDDAVDLVLSSEAAIGGTLRQRLEMFFPDATVVEAERGFPPVDDDAYVAGARLALRDDYCLQIANPLGASGMETDPYEELLPAMTGTAGARAVVQVAFRPAPEEWWRRWFVPLGVGESLRTEPPLLPRQVTCTDLVDGGELRTDDERVRDMLRGQQTESAFVTDVRVCGIGETATAAEAVVADVAAAFEERYDDPATGQGLVPLGVPARRLRDWFDRVVERRLPEPRPRLGRYQCEPCLLTVPELAALAHVPSQKEYDDFSLTVPGFEWADEPARE